MAFELRAKEDQFEKALAAALGISLQAMVAPPAATGARNPFGAVVPTFAIAIPGQSFGVQVDVLNQSPEVVAVDAVKVEAVRRQSVEDRRARRRRRRRSRRMHRIACDCGCHRARRRGADSAVFHAARRRAGLLRSGGPALSEPPACAVSSFGQRPVDLPRRGAASLGSGAGDADAFPP